MTGNYREIYSQSIQNPEEFWKKISEDVFWYKKPTKILNNFILLFINGSKTE